MTLIVTDGMPCEPRERATQWTYWQHTLNHCLGCGHASWLIGQFSAECAFCKTALALDHSAMLGSGMFRRCHRRN